MIYVLEGEGYTEVKPGGVVHQHFDKHEDRPARWIAFIHYQIREWAASQVEQVDEHPDFSR